MSTVKYKAASRYSFGWTDPRGLFGNNPYGAEGFGEVPIASDHFSRDMTVDQLKAAWLIVFGDPLS